MASTANGRNGSARPAENQAPPLESRHPLPGNGIDGSDRKDDLVPADPEKRDGTNAHPIPGDPVPVPADGAFERIRDNLRKSSVSLGNALDGQISTLPSLWGLWSRRESKSGRKLRPPRLTLTPVGSGIEAVFDDDELGYTFTVFASLFKDVPKLVDAAIDGKEGVTKAKTKGAAARRAQDAARQAEEARIRDVIRKQNS